jgi:CDP-diacylglycerol--glycerol-3-phosphate 3-phosphatidyltransferase
MANLITAIRILCSISLLFCAAFSPWFYALYITAGVSDMVDGWVARKTNTVSDFGSKLDTIADIIFVVVCLVKLLPVLHLPVWIYVWVGIIAGIKVFNIVYSYVVRKQFLADHSILNKVTGALLFLLPLTLFVVDVKYSAAVVCMVATIAGIQEGVRVKLKHCAK